MIILWFLCFCVSPPLNSPPVICLLIQGVQSHVLRIQDFLLFKHFLICEMATILCQACHTLPGGGDDCDNSGAHGPSLAQSLPVLLASALAPSIFVSVLFPLPEVLLPLGGRSYHSGSLVLDAPLLCLSIFHLPQWDLIFQLWLAFYPLVNEFLWAGLWLLRLCIWSFCLVSGPS